MVRRIDRTAVNPVDPVSIPKQDKPVVSTDSFIRGTKGISGPVAQVKASRFGDPITNFFASFRTLPQAGQADQLAELTRVVFKDQPRRG